MITSIARKEFTEIVRDGRFKWTAAIMVLLLLTAMLAGYQRRQREAIQEAEQIIDHAREEAERFRAKAEADMEESIARREQQATDKITQAEAAALEEIREKVVEMAIDATAMLLEQKMAGKAGEQAVADAIEDIPKKLH